MLPLTLPEMTAERLIAVATAFVSYLLWKATKKQAEIAQTQANAALAADSAWLRVDLEQPLGGGEITTGDSKIMQGTRWENTWARFGLTCTNVGKTPASIIETRVALRLFKTIPSKPDLSVCEAEKVSPYVLAANEPGPRFDMDRNTANALTQGRVAHSSLLLA